MAFDWMGLVSLALWTCPSTPVQSQDLTNESWPLKRKLNIVARTESRGDTDSSTVKDTAFVVCRTVFITHTALMWWDNIKETRAVAWFWENHWEKEAVKQKRRQISWGWHWWKCLVNVEPKTDKRALLSQKKNQIIHYTFESSQTYLLNCHQLRQPEQTHRG